MNYDLIGDIHGHADSLRALLTSKLGYQLRDGVYRHPSRQAIFLGDFIDRGPGQRETLGIVRPMVESGTALAIMGNHEFNAIAYATPDGSGGHLRSRNEGNRRNHSAFLDAVGADSAEHRDAVAWFRKLPLWLDLAAFRVVHACWDEAAISLLSRAHRGPELTEALLRQAAMIKSPEHDAIETLLKGRELSLPKGHEFKDADGTGRTAVRIKWWASNARTFGELAVDPDHVPAAAFHMTAYPAQAAHYPAASPPVFLGHYMLPGEPAPLAANVFCLDYGVIRSNGQLVAYRLLEPGKTHGEFVAQPRLEP